MYQIIGTWAVTLQNCDIKAQAMSLNLTEVYERVPMEIWIIIHLECGLL